MSGNKIRFLPDFPTRTKHLSVMLFPILSLVTNSIFTKHKSRSKYEIPYTRTTSTLGNKKRRFTCISENGFSLSKMFVVRTQNSWKMKRS